MAEIEGSRGSQETTKIGRLFLVIFCTTFFKATDLGNGLAFFNAALIIPSAG